LVCKPWEEAYALEQIIVLADVRTSMLFGVAHEEGRRGAQCAAAFNKSKRSVTAPPAHRP